MSDDYAHARRAWHDAEVVSRAAKMELVAACPRDQPAAFIMGDSIAVGFWQGSYAFDPSEPQSALRHIDRLIGPLSNGRIAGCYTAAAGVGPLAKLLRRAIRPGDALVYQDWGWRPRSYRAT